MCACVGAYAFYVDNRVLIAFYAGTHASTQANV